MPLEFEGTLDKLREYIALSEHGHAADISITLRTIVTSMKRGSQTP